MLTLQCTKKLADELKLNLSKITLTESDPLYCWHIHLFTLNRRKCVLAMNNRTRYNFMMYGLKKKEFDSFDKQVMQAIRENLLADHIDEKQVEGYVSHCSPITYAPTSDRSILGQINEMIAAIRYWYEIAEGERDLYVINRRLNRFVMLKLPKYSGELMQEELEKLGPEEHPVHAEEIDSQLVHAVSMAKEARLTIERKQEEVLWKESNGRLSLRDALTSLTKEDLHHIRKNLDIRKTSALKKQEMVELFACIIPEKLVSLVFLFDEERYTIVRNAERNEGSTVVPEMDNEKIVYFQQRGILFPSMAQGQKIMTMPEEVLTVIRTIDERTISPIIQRNTEWIKLTRGLLYYYGTLDISVLMDQIKSYTDETVDTQDYIYGMAESAAYDKEMKLDGFGFSHYRVFDSGVVHKEHLSRPAVAYYPFDRKQLLAAGEPGFVDRNLSYQQFVSSLMKLFDLTRQKADMIAEECVYAIRLEEPLQNMITYIQYQVEIGSMSQMQELVNKLMNLMNNTRQWHLKGHTPEELFAEEKKELKPLPAKPFGTPSGTVYNFQTKKKVGRNDPCPCGSGKKYKKCCGG